MATFLSGIISTPFRTRFTETHRLASYAGRCMHTTHCVYYCTRIVRWSQLLRFVLTAGIHFTDFRREAFCTHVLGRPRWSTLRIWQQCHYPPCATRHVQRATTLEAPMAIGTTTSKGHIGTTPRRSTRWCWLSASCCSCALDRGLSPWWHAWQPPATYPGSGSNLTKCIVTSLEGAPDPTGLRGHFLIGQFLLADGRIAVLLHNQDPARTQWATVTFAHFLNTPTRNASQVTEVSPEHGTEAPFMDDSPLYPGLQMGFAPGMARFLVANSS